MYCLATVHRLPTRDFTAPLPRLLRVVPKSPTKMVVPKRSPHVVTGTSIRQTQRRLRQLWQTPNIHRRRLQQQACTSPAQPRISPIRLAKVSLSLASAQCFEAPSAPRRLCVRAKGCARSQHEYHSGFGPADSAILCLPWRWSR